MSTVSSNSSFRRALVYYCRCREPVVWKTSWTDSNPGRRFVGCLNYGTPKFCQFMEWRDPEVHPRYRDVILGLLRKAENIREEKPKEKSLCGRHTCFISLFLVVFIAFFLLFCSCKGCVCQECYSSGH
ncbi:hypothetical protein DM860_016598 [Cuscuta australis]|uniref:Zinc finger GRF-type domain-containing protein n=1 Tax=Cuscuta australis TaxID=267555 RepID=A0A328DMY2_9ASTE|nr:hypothetical protein DM860_016598 [Cuscuta australis]